ncbi:hypothetical protein AB7M17_006973 [Bradyrhizobium sp. USDA 377]
MAQFSPRSMGAYAAIWRPYNDIDIFVEDSSLRGLYERMFQRMLKGIARVSAVIPLQNRAAVTAEAERLQNDLARRRFFLVDGDFEWSVGKIRRVRNLYTLRCYSIENIAWSMDTIHSAARLVAPGMTDAEIRGAITNAELDAIVRALFPIFVAYSICFRLGSNCETVGFSIVRLIEDGERTKLCRKKISSRVREIYRHIRLNFGLAALPRERKKVENMLLQRKVEPWQFVAGKGYLLTILLFIFNERLDYKGSLRLLFSLLLHEPSKLEAGLQRAVRRAASR